jgi:hypothetical protein
MLSVLLQLSFCLTWSGDDSSIFYHAAELVAQTIPTNHAKSEILMKPQKLELQKYHKKERK